MAQGGEGASIEAGAEDELDRGGEDEGESHRQRGDQERECQEEDRGGGQDLAIQWGPGR